MKRRNDIPTKTFALLAAAALTMACHSYEVIDTPDRALAPVPVNPVVATAPTSAIGLYWGEVADDCDCERDTIYQLVRQHRRGASDLWKNRLTDAIFSEAQAADVDPLIVASIVASESSFKSQIVSHAGAVGLMQLRPFVAEDVALRVDVDWRGVHTLNDPALNVRLGIQYYQELLDRFDGNLEQALTAYNYGPTRVAKQIRTGTYEGSRYAKKIMALYGQLDVDRVEQARPTAI